VLLFLVNSEELVWRGSMLPRLQARWSALGASVFIGVFEGLFHLPVFFQPGSDQAAAGLPVFVIGSIAGRSSSPGCSTTPWAACYWSSCSTSSPTHGSRCSALRPRTTSLASGSSTGLLVVLATIVVIACGARRLSRSSRARPTLDVLAA
jgi:hypothetical protein